MAGQKIELGQSGRAVAENLKRARTVRNLTYADVSRRMSELGRKLPPLAVRKIEDGQRRVDVDDFVCLAVALDASPSLLLAPTASGVDQPAEGTGTGVLPARDLYSWIRGEHSLGGQGFDAFKDTVDLMPEWRRADVLEGLTEIWKLNAKQYMAKNSEPSEALAEAARKLGVDLGDD